MTKLELKQVSDEVQDDTASETPFMDYVKTKKRHSKGTREKKQRRKPLAYEKKAELEKRFEKIYPEVEKPFSAKTVDDVQIGWKEGTERVLITSKPMEKRTYEYKANPNIIALLNLSSSKIYYNLEDDCYYLYVFSLDRKRILRKIKLEKHDIQWLLAFALYDRYGEDLPKQLWINRDIKNKVQKIVEREKQHYETIPFYPPTEKPSNYSGNTVENTIVLASLKGLLIYMILKMIGVNVNG